MHTLELQNHYYLMRHGQSLANVQGIIVSHPESGTQGFGLTDAGRRQVLESAKTLRTKIEEVVIYSSDFLRARETAELVKATLSLNRPVEYSALLRERDFGDFEKRSDDCYQTVWSRDREDADSGADGVESVASVLKRAGAFIQKVEAGQKGKNILVVSHGDVLQIMQTLFEGTDGRLHRRILHLEQAEIRYLGS